MSVHCPIRGCGWHGSNEAARANHMVSARLVHELLNEKRQQFFKRSIRHKKFMKYVRKKLKREKRKREREANPNYKPTRTSGSGYKAGVSCGRGMHEWVNHGTYMTCTKCKSTRSIKRNRVGEL